MSAPDLCQAFETGQKEGKNLENQDQQMAARAAKIIRIITLPPFMIAALLLVLDHFTADMFTERRDLIIAWIGLVLLPLLAYPVHGLIPGLRKTGREGQRATGFVFSLVGYVAVFIDGFFASSGKVRLLFSVYFFTVVILSILNKAAHIRASGHAASSVSPCVFSGMYVGILPCCLFSVVFLLSVVSSVYLKRHKVSDIIAGIVSFVFAFCLSCLLVNLTGQSIS